MTDNNSDSIGVLIELAARCEAAGIRDAREAPHSDLYAKTAFHKLSVAAALRALAAQPTGEGSQS